MSLVKQLFLASLCYLVVFGMAVLFFYFIGICKIWSLLHNLSQNAFRCTLFISNALLELCFRMLYLALPLPLFFQEFPKVHFREPGLSWCNSWKNVAGEW